MTRLPRRYFFNLISVRFPYVVNVSLEYEVKQHPDFVGDYDYDGWEPLLWCIDRFGVKNIASGSRQHQVGWSTRRSYCAAPPYVAMRGTTIRFKYSGDAALCKLLFGG